MDCEDEGGTAGFVTVVRTGLGLGLNDREDSDVAGAENGSDLGDDAGLVADLEAKVVFGDGLIEGDRGTVVAVWKEAVVSDSGGEVVSDICEVGNDRGRGGVLAGAGTVEKGFADDVAAKGKGVEDTVDVREDVLLGKEGGLGADFDGTVSALLDDADELDVVAKLLGYRSRQWC